jgi:hypothetical protein
MAEPLRRATPGSAMLLQVGRIHVGQRICQGLATFWSLALPGC